MRSVVLSRILMLFQQNQHQIKHTHCNSKPSYRALGHATLEDMIRCISHEAETIPNAKFVAGLCFNILFLK
jgi:hypothetical protein